MITVAAYDIHVEQLFETVRRLHAALSEAQIPYRVMGGVAVFLQVYNRDPGKARMTQDVDVAIDRNELSRISAAAAKHGFQYRHGDGVDKLVDAKNLEHRDYLIFIREEVRPEYLEAVPGFSEPTVSSEGVLIAPVADLVKMKLTSFRLIDKVHIQDMDSVGLITSEIEAALFDTLKARLAEVRATE
jgi:hypothetical protein